MSAKGNKPYESEGTLKFAKGDFSLDGKPFKILSAAVHYFRTFPEYWEDRLTKVKACGLNTVETYVPWNLHEEYPGQFNFEGILDVRKFIMLAQDLGLYVIFRPGPYICSEWDFGGLPAWLLSDPDMKVRSNYKNYTDAVERFFNKLLPMVEDLQYSRGGPIIAFQIENEFGSYSSEIEHLIFLKNLYLRHNLTELFLTSDNAWGYKNDPFYQHALPTANFQKMSEGQQVFDQIRNWSSDFPLMVTEFWTGWFDHWGSEHGGLPLDKYEESLSQILQNNASVNFYMFHGGTNFGFMNGANKEENNYKPDVSSYDYDALLTEKGDITPKYLKTREMLLEKIYKPQGIKSLPEPPKNITSSAYGTVSVDGYLSFEDLLKSKGQVNISSDKAVPMEMLKLKGGYGQNYGYILYRCTIPGNSSVLSFENQPADRAQIYIDGSEVAVIDWKSNNKTVKLQADGSKSERRLDILVENNGRVNYAKEETGILNSERKGVSGSVSIDGKAITNFTIFPLEFKNNTVTRDNWQGVPNVDTVPGLFKATLNITQNVTDTFIFLRGWGKGIVFVNGFNLGRYWIVGPQQTLYVPAPVLKQGANQIVIFEHQKIGTDIVFTDKPILDVNNQTQITNL
ncbi:beta-galactosidase-1-like protein 2 isoform X2 [Ruditapes philippinarum]|uniref:beta-galactosidase-1-like protein 2 isoform X2 n=1 Tax=Ruditapes philippinarum TaxID=129788 RepID=UPI00295A77CB|nr:beta-galactosidase-1-like protein 2 isoform X2 [Ruditapes philippinarum]